MADAATIAAVVAGIQGVMLGNVDNVTDERRTQVATVACEAVESYAPMAPDATKLEAATQMASYLLGTASRMRRCARRRTRAEPCWKSRMTGRRRAMRSATAGRRSLLSPFKSGAARELIG